MLAAASIGIKPGRIIAFLPFIPCHTFYKALKFFSFASASPPFVAESGTAPDSSGKASRDVLYTTPHAPLKIAAERTSAA